MDSLKLSFYLFAMFMVILFWGGLYFLLGAVMLGAVIAGLILSACVWQQTRPRRQED